MSSAAAKRGVLSSLQGPRPLPLSLPGTTASSSTSSPPRPAKRPRVTDEAAAGPVIVYEHTPKVIHARPDEFKALVQRLTGRTAGGDQDVVFQPAQTPAALSSSSQQVQDPLVLTLGQQHIVPPLYLVDDDDHALPVVLPPSPGGAGGFLFSPSSFLFSPATMQAIQELIS